MAAAQSKMHLVSKNVVHWSAEVGPLACGSPMQIVADTLHYFGRHFRDSIAIGELAQMRGISEDCLDFSFDRIRGMTPAQALQDYRLNKLFAGVLGLFELTFRIDMPLFLLTCRRAADDRLFRRQHPEPEALVLPV
jgi:hypothetical protein